MIAEVATNSEALQVGMWILGAGFFLNFALGAVKLWRIVHGEPERRSVNLVADNATKDEVAALVDRVKEVERDLDNIRGEMKTDREALTKAAEERARYLNAQIQDVLRAVSEVNGVVIRMREEKR